MMESRDSVIKLFGQSIPLQPDREEHQGYSSNTTTTTHETKDQDQKLADPKQKTEHSKPLQNESAESLSNKEETPSKSNNTNNSSPQETQSTNSSTDNSNSNSNSNPNPKTPLKKPDKILPCPRCHSMETKFCYYNNYNINQPRHFCKNCQRYWTAGGSMRNVPVGAGRRKSKNNSSVTGPHFYRHITLSDQSLLQPIQSGSIGSKTNGTVLSFGADQPPHCESVVDRFHLVENRDENSSGSSSVDGSKGREEVKKKARVETNPSSNGAATATWPYMWGPVPTVYNAPSFGVQLYPYWGCIPFTDGTAWTVQPWMNGATASPVSAGPNSVSVSKVSMESNQTNINSLERDGEKENLTQERNIWIPKTLRIDNPEEAAKSSIWTLIGIRNEKSDKIGVGKVVNMFESKGEIKENGIKSSQLFCANPAALARSINFQESS